MFGSRVAAVLFGIPLAFAALDVPASLMIHEMRLRQSANIHSRNSLPIFTTDSVRGQFLDPRGPYALENFRENYYRANVPYGAIIYREARKNALPPELVAAMVHTESDFRPRLASQTAAHGLMQIVPSTAALLGIDEPLDPEQNIAAGTRYFRHLLNRYDDETLALAAYNAGETNVARFGGVPPFQETQEYIAKVNRRTHRYRDGVRNAYLANVKIRVDEPMQPQ
jgi:soluble lytic murein transglycosylase-like protein